MSKTDARTDLRQARDRLGEAIKVEPRLLNRGQLESALERVQDALWEVESAINGPDPPRKTYRIVLAIGREIGETFSLAENEQILAIQKRIDGRLDLYILREGEQ